MTNESQKAALLKQVYDDALSPAMKQLGGVLESTAKCARFIAAPIEALSTQQDRWQNYLNRLNDKVPEESMVQANPSLTMKVLEGLQYQSEDSILAELFLNLLAKAINKDKQSLAHPGFAFVISNLVPDEAMIVYLLKEKEYPLVQHSVYHKATNLFGPKDTIRNDFPLDKLVYPDNFFMYLDHLHSLNIAGVWQIGNQYPVMADGVQTGIQIVSSSRLTSFGKLFAEACLPDNIDKFHF